MYLLVQFGDGHEVSAATGGLFSMASACGNSSPVPELNERPPAYRSPHLSFCRSTSKNSIFGGRTSHTQRGDDWQLTRSPCPSGWPTWPSMVRYALSSSA